MIFSSKKQFDTDPYPFTHQNGGRIPRRYGLPGFDTYAPRDEYLIPQTNPTNPILAAFREREDQRNIFAVRQWLAFVSGVWDGSICEATPAHVDHARRVLRRVLTKLESGW